MYFFILFSSYLVVDAQNFSEISSVNESIITSVNESIISLVNESIITSVNESIFDNEVEIQTGKRLITVILRYSEPSYRESSLQLICCRNTSTNAK